MLANTCSKLNLFPDFVILESKISYVSVLEGGLLSTQKQSVTKVPYSKSNSAKVRRAIAVIRSQGFTYYSQNYLKRRLYNSFLKKKQYTKLNDCGWKEINFKALNLHGSAKILLNPLDMGFSREFNVYGFREPLNTYAFFCNVAKKKPVVLDIGGNLGYFSLIELQAGAKKVISVEPVPSTFGFLTKTLEKYKDAKPLNIAISDHKESLKLYVGTDLNVTSSFRQLFVNTDHLLAYEIMANAETLQSMEEKYPITMIRMDVEGHEYRILSERIPDQIDSINIELHVLPPFNKKHAVNLLQCLSSQNFKVHTAINEMSYEYYDFVHRFGLKRGYKLARALGSKLTVRPCIQVNPSFQDIVDKIPERGQIHLTLER